MFLSLETRSSGSLHSRIAEALRRKIDGGELEPGTRLPTTRALAADLEVSRSTVVRAYEQLEREGWVEAKVGSGTIIRSRSPEPRPAAIDWDLLIAPQARGPEPWYVETLRMLSSPDVISFSGGLPAPDLFPVEAIQQITRDVLRDEGTRILQGCPVEGYPPLRTWIAQREGVELDEVLILTGSTQGLHLLSQALVQSGDLILVENPTYAGALRTFETAGAHVVALPTRDGRLDTRQIDSLLARARPKFIYTIPTYRNPTGRSLTQEEREQIVALASKHQIPLIEDDPYSLLRYGGAVGDSLRAIDETGVVIRLSTFSKILFPGLRVGWLVAPPELIHRLSSSRSLMDLFVNGPSQASLYRFCQRGLLDGHLRRVLPVYRERRDAMAEALGTYCPQLTFDVPEGGFFIWARLPEGITSRPLLQHALSGGVSFVGGELFHSDGSGSEHIRLCFACHTPEEIRDGVRRLGLALARLLASSEREHGGRVPVEYVL